jgi:hypothetical protein
MYRYHHIALAVPQLEAGMAEIGEAMGLAWRPIQQTDTTVRDSAGTVHPAPVRVTYSKGSAPAVEVFEAISGTPLDAPVGSPFHHVGVWVDDLAAESARLEAAGWSYFAGTGVGRQSLYRGPTGLVLELCDVTCDRPWLCDLFPASSPHFGPEPGSSA